MIAERPDWCVSRQRFWGVPLVIFYCDKCGKQFDDYAALHALVAKWFRKEGADAWFTHSVEELLACGHELLVRRRGLAQGNRHSGRVVRFGLVASGGARSPRAYGQKLPWPADMYLEGPDQYRGWFHSSLLIGVAVRDGAPYRHVLTHGWTLDDQGPADVEIARQRRAARPKCARSGAPTCCACGWPRRTTPPTCACPTT